MWSIRHSPHRPLPPFRDRPPPQANRPIIIIRPTLPTNERRTSDLSPCQPPLLSTYNTGKATNMQFLCRSYTVGPMGSRLPSRCPGKVPSRDCTHVSHQDVQDRRQATGLASETVGVGRTAWRKISLFCKMAGSRRTRAPSASAAASSSADEDHDPAGDDGGGKRATAGSSRGGGRQRSSARRGRQGRGDTGAPRERAAAAAGGRRSSQRGQSSHAEAAAAGPGARRYDPERGALKRLLARLRREGEATGRGDGGVDADRAAYLLEASAGNVVLASGLYWEVRAKI